MVKHYGNEAIVVHWDATRCIHTGLCTRGLPDVFDASRRPWIVLAGADADDVEEVVRRCPTGALRCTRTDGAPPEPAPEVTTIVAVPDGPLYVRGPIEITTQDGSVVAAEDRLALCRCGATGNPPFCDNSHRRVGYRSREPVVDQRRLAAANPGDICPPQDS